MLDEIIKDSVKVSNDWGMYPYCIKLLNNDHIGVRFDGNATKSEIEQQKSDPDFWVLTINPNIEIEFLTWLKLMCI